MNYRDLEEYISQHRKVYDRTLSFVEYLYKMMDKYHVDGPTLYNKANISKQLYSSIISNKSHPSLKVCIKIVFALKMTNSECKLLLKKAGFTLASNSDYSLIIRYFLENSIYDLGLLNEVFMRYGYTDLID